MMANHRLNPNSDSAVGQHIRELRRSQGRTQKDIARVIGITGAQLHRYETGISRIATGRLIAIAQALGVGPDALISAGRNPDHAASVLPRTETGDGDDIMELIEVFTRIADPRQRKVVMAVVRMMAGRHLLGGPADS